jgi:periplasmic protein TonB
VKKGTVLVSLAIHVAVAIALLAGSQKRASGKSFFVQLQEEKKKEMKEKAKAAPPKPKVAKVDRPPPERKAAPAPVKAAPVQETHAPVAKLPVAPIAMDLAMSNEDIGDAVAIPVARPAQTAAPTKLASMDAEPKRRRIHELGPGGPAQDERCTEEPSKPEPVFKTDIEYTAAARAEGIEGKLKLKVLVGADGSVLSVEVLASVSPELDAAAVAAVKHWRFRPAMACGKPVAGGSYVLARRFELGD